MRPSPTTRSNAIRLGLCSALNRLWTRLVMKTVLPERLRPVAASHTVEPPASSVRLVASATHPNASDTMGESQGTFAIRIGLGCAGSNIGAVYQNESGAGKPLEIMAFAWFRFEGKPVIMATVAGVGW